MWIPSPLPRTFAACERDVHSAKPDVRASAVTDLVRHARTDETRTMALELLVSALSDESPRVRARAAIAFADAHVPETELEQPALDAMLAAADDSDDEVRQMTITALGEIGDERALPSLSRASHDDRASMRYQAVIAIARMASVGDETRIKALLRASSDDDFNIRYIAMRLAEEHFATKPHERLRLRAVALLDDDERDVSIAAAIFLGHSGDERGKPLLRRIVRGEIPVQREDEREAVELVGALGMNDLVPDLEKRAFGLGRHVKDTCSFHAMIALARLGHPRAVAAIQKDMSSRSEKRREAATIAAERAELAPPADERATTR